MCVTDVTSKRVTATAPPISGDGSTAIRNETSEPPSGSSTSGAPRPPPKPVLLFAPPDEEVAPKPPPAAMIEPTTIVVFVFAESADVAAVAIAAAVRCALPEVKAAAEEEPPAAPPPIPTPPPPPIAPFAPVSTSHAPRDFDETIPPLVPLLSAPIDSSSAAPSRSSRASAHPPPLKPPPQVGMGHRRAPMTQRPWPKRGSTRRRHDGRMSNRRAAGGIDGVGVSTDGTEPSAAAAVETV